MQEYLTKENKNNNSFSIRTFYPKKILHGSCSKNINQNMLPRTAFAHIWTDTVNTIKNKLNSSNDELFKNVVIDESIYHGIPHSYHTSDITFTFPNSVNINDSDNLYKKICDATKDICTEMGNKFSDYCKEYFKEIDNPLSEFGANEYATYNIYPDNPYDRKFNFEMGDIFIKSYVLSPVVAMKLKKIPLFEKLYDEMKHKDGYISEYVYYDGKNEPHIYSNEETEELGLDKRKLDYTKEYIPIVISKNNNKLFLNVEHFNVFCEDDYCGMSVKKSDKTNEYSQEEIKEIQSILDECISNGINLSKEPDDKENLKLLDNIINNIEKDKGYDERDDI